MIVIRWLTKPSPNITEPVIYQQAQLLVYSALSIVLGTVGFLAAIYLTDVIAHNPTGSFVNLLFATVAYILSRTVHFKAGAIILPLGLTIAGFISVLSFYHAIDVISVLFVLTIPPFFVNIFFGNYLMYLFVTLNIAIMLSAPFLSSATFVLPDDLVLVMIVNIVFPLLFQSGYNYHENLAKFRRIEINKSEALLKRAQQVAHVGHWNWNIETGVWWWSDEVYRIFGLDPEQGEASFTAFLTAIVPVDRDKVSSAVKQALIKNDFSIDHRIICPNGEIGHVHEEGEVSYGPDGKPIRMLGIVHDRTERVKAEEADSLRESEQHFRYLIENGSDLINVLDTTGKISYTSPSSARLLGYTSNEMDGRDFCSFMESKDIAAFTKHMESGAVNPGESRLIEFLLIHKDGSSKFFQSILKCFVDAQDNFRIVITSRDLTEAREMEYQLRQSQKMEAIGQLAAGVAHEINTPIQYIGDNLRFLEDSFGDLWPILDTQKAVLDAAAKMDALKEEVNRQSTAMAEADIDYLHEEIPVAISQSLEGVAQVSKIVQAMKDFSHPGSDNKVQANINHAIESAVTIARNEWKYVADMKLELDNTLPQLPLLVGEFNQAILNLLINAVHAIQDVTGEDSDQQGQITVRTRQKDNGILVSVSDTGEGIPENIRNRIFEPFFTTKDVGQGTGQGLAMVHSVTVERHGGRVTFDSKLGQGTTFYLWFPLEPSEGDTMAEVAADA